MPETCAVGAERARWGQEDGIQEIITPKGARVAVAVAPGRPSVGETCGVLKSRVRDDANLVLHSGRPRDTARDRVHQGERRQPVPAGDSTASHWGRWSRYQWYQSGRPAVNPSSWPRPSAYSQPVRQLLAGFQVNRFDTPRCPCGRVGRPVAAAPPLRESALRYSRT